MPVFFAGRLIETPTTASVVNDDAMRNKNLAVGNSVALLGRSASGAPKTALRFGSPQQAQATLASGELLDAVLAAFDPSAETGSPQEIVAIRVNPATQSTLTLKGAGAVDVINLTSTDYGAGANLVRVKVEAGSTSGLRVTTQRGNDYYTKDNLERKALSIHYTGGEASATLTVNGTQAVLAAPSGSTVATIAFADYPTVQDLVDRINLTAGFTASVMDANYTAPTLNGLDYVTTQDVKTAAYTAKADLQAVVDWFNSASEGFVNATRISAVGIPPAAAAFQFMTGGSDGTVTNNDWSDAFEVLQGIDVQWLCPVSSDSAIHAMADTHAGYMSTVGRKERRVVVGTASSTTDDQAIAAAKALNSDRTSLVHLGHYNYNALGQLTLYPPYISAALITGMFAGVSPGTPLTNKTIKVRGLERELRNPTDTDALIRGGVFCLESTEDGYKVVQSISTCLWSDKFNRREQSTGAAVDFVARTVRRAIDALRGSKSDPILISRYRSVAESALRELATPEPNGPGVIVGDADNPAYRNITATVEGDVVNVSFECSPVIPNNYALATIYCVPFSGTATA